MKATLITTVKNEEKSMGLFLDSIKKQIKKPDEIIVVDGGSSDETIQNLKFKSQKLKLKVKIIERRGNRSVGRNVAIKASSNSIIAVSDVGCILDKYWLEHITRPFEDDEVDVVAGFYKPVANSVFEKCLATYTCTMPGNLDKTNFLPSSRSVAFRKRAWEKAEGYSEKLDTCEDLVFDKKLKKTGARFVTEEKAIVYWPQRKNIFQATMQFYRYAVGDGQARYFRKTTPLLFIRYIIGICLVWYIIVFQVYSLLPITYLLFIIYLLWAISKNYKYIKNFRAFLYLPLLQLTSDVSVILGTTIGFLKSI